MIYTKTGATHQLFKEECFKKLSDAQLENNSIYWYDQHDMVLKDTPFNSCIEDAHWEHLRTDPTSKLLAFYGDEYFNILDVDDWCSTILKRQINPNQFYLIVMDENWVNWTIAKMKERGVDGINIQPYNLLMRRVQIQQHNVPVSCRFSALSRNYNAYRLNMYAELYQRDLLKHFTYTFNNIFPYSTGIAHQNITIIPKEKILEDLATLGYDSLQFSEWVNNMPYTFDNSPVLDKMADATFTAIKQSGINLLIESHFDPFWHTQGERKRMTPWDLSPAFPTEKTYKAVASQRSFIAFTTPMFLKEFKELGYQTFAPFIDETYDTIVNDKLRLAAIADEITRICNLSDNDFKTLLTNCEEIVKHNYAVFLRKQKETKLYSKFDWLSSYVNRNNETYPFLKEL